MKRHRHCAGLRRVRTMVLWALGAVLGAALAAAPPPEQDDRGRPLAQPRTPQRVVSLLPSLTETVCVLGACDRLVGVDRFSDWPKAALQSLPVVGGGLDPNIEALVALRPDVVLMSRTPRVAQRLEQLGLRTIVLEPHTQAEVERVFHAVARVLDMPPSRAQQAWTRVQSGIDEAARSVSPSTRQWRAYFEVSQGPFVAGPSSFIGELMAQLGLRNVVPAELGPFPRLSPEFLARSQPDVILMGSHSMEVAPRQPGWQSLKAVQAGRVCGFDAQESAILVRPGPRMDEAARILARCLQRLPAVPGPGAAHAP